MTIICLRIPALHEVGVGPVHAGDQPTFSLHMPWRSLNTLRSSLLSARGVGADAKGDIRPELSGREHGGAPHGHALAWCLVLKV